MVLPSDFLQGNLGRFWYFDVSKGPGEKNSRLSGLCQSGVFSSLTWSQSLKGWSQLFFFTNGVNYVIHLFSFISLGGWRPVLMSALNICEFLGPPGPKKGPKMAQNDCKDTVTMSGWKTHHVGTTMKDRSFFHLALLRHQNIKTSLNFLKENHWARPFFALFSSVREKLQLTVSLNHPVQFTMWQN